MAKRWFQSVDLEIDEAGKPTFESALEALAALIANGRLKVDAAGVTLTADLIDLDVDAITGAPPGNATLADLAARLLSSVGASAADHLYGIDMGTSYVLDALTADGPSMGLADYLAAIFGNTGEVWPSPFFASVSGATIADLLFDSGSSDSVAGLLGRGPGSGYTISQLLEDVAIALNPLGGAYRDGSGWGENSSLRVVSGDGAGAEKVATEFTLYQVANSLIGGPYSDGLAQMMMGPWQPSGSYEGDMEPGAILAGGLFGGPYATSVARKLTAYNQYVMDQDLGDFLADALCTSGAGIRLADLLADPNSGGSVFVDGMGRPVFRDSTYGQSAGDWLAEIGMALQNSGSVYVADLLTAHGPNIGLADYLADMFGFGGQYGRNPLYLAGPDLSVAELIGELLSNVSGGSPLYMPGPMLSLGEGLQSAFFNDPYLGSPLFYNSSGSPMLGRVSIGELIGDLVSGEANLVQSPLYTAGGTSLADLLYSISNGTSVADSLNHPLGTVADLITFGMQNWVTGLWLPDMLQGDLGDTVASLLSQGTNDSHTWSTLTGPGATAAYSLNYAARDHILSATVANINTSVTVRLEGTIDGTNFFPMAADLAITANGTQAIQVGGQGGVTAVRGNFVSEDGGTAATVTFKYRGTR
ncbi:MAG: hypothetical protein BIFFINMI_00330 [Phycisphaerae bacterium]|nr:hypothetical protein [Phycisphaerae bacterium]